MTRGIILFGSSGAGTTTIGREVARRLGFPHYDLDDYLWRKDTPLPFSATTPREELKKRLMADIDAHPHFVMSGSMDSYNQPFMPLFDLAVLVHAPADVRVARVEARESGWFGGRILPGGDMHENHLKFIDGIRRYDTDGSPSRAVHEQWASTLPCPVLRIDGTRPVEENVVRILVAYAGAVGSGEIRRENPT